MSELPLKRKQCQRCERPIKACVCDFCVATENLTKVVILQHPTEQGRTKGTADLLRLSLAQCQVVVGEDFSQCQELAELVQNYPDQVYLLYPGEQASDLSDTVFHSTERPQKPKVIVLIDATWKKAFKMYSLSTNLKALPCIALPEGIEGRYRIRKTSKKAALSTLEACCHALSFIENDQKNYQKLLESFEKFNDFQLSFRPQQHLTQ